MFSSAERQRRRQGKYGTPRDQYLQELVTQFQNSVDDEQKERLVAHLANFAYDPFNYADFRKLKLHVVDLFLDCLTESNEKLVQFGIEGLCNCSADPASADAIVKSDGIPLLISCLSSPVQKTALAAMTTLYYVCSPSTRTDIVTPQVIEAVTAYASSTNVCSSNIGRSFLAKHSTT